MAKNCLICIPVYQIVGVCEAKEGIGVKTFVTTGADTPDGGKNGFYVSNEYDAVRAALKCALDD